VVVLLVAVCLAPLLSVAQIIPTPTPASPSPTPTATATATPTPTASSGDTAGCEWSDDFQACLTNVERLTLLGMRQTNSFLAMFVGIMFFAILSRGIEP
jgi:hypothetical protein